MYMMILKNVIIDLVIANFIALSGGQTCVNNPDVNQKGEVFISSGRQVIVPRAKFNCSGKITIIAVSMSQPDVIINLNLPLFQVWRPTSFNTSTYNKISEFQLPAGYFVAVDDGRHYHYANLRLNASSQIEFQPGDVIGYYQPSEPQRLIGSIQTSGYTSYSNNVTSSLTSIDTNNVDNIENNYQPLIEVMFDVQCCSNNLSAPANGNVSCSSGTVGVGYKGDTCNFTCNPGYELTGSETRTCQSDGSWSGIDNECRRIPCPPLDNASNGMINCLLLGDDNFTSYEDICIITCNTGDELTAAGNDTRICQSDGSWSTTDSLLCIQVQCTNLSSPTNGNVSCNSTDVSRYEDRCLFSCDHGYELTGSVSRQCLSNGSWSGEPVTCNILRCSDPGLEIVNSQPVGMCDWSYGSRCLLNCLNGFNSNGSGEHMCDDVNEEGTLVKWRSIGSSFTCVRGNNNGEGETDTASVIGGILGGIILLLAIIFAFFIVLCSMRWFHYKKEVADLKSSCNVDLTPNPSYDTNQQRTKQEYSTREYATPNKFFDLQLDTIKWDTNPSYKRNQEHETTDSNNENGNNEAGPEHEVPIQLNPSYNSKLTKKSEDHHDYVEVDQDHSHSAEGTGYSYLELIEPTTEEKIPAVAVDTTNVTSPSYVSGVNDRSC